MNVHKGQVVGYARVSTADQNEARQVEALGEVDRLCIDTASGADRHRSELKRLERETIRERQAEGIAIANPAFGSTRRR